MAVHEKTLLLFEQIWLAFLLILPNMSTFNHWRASYYRRIGNNIAPDVIILPNVRITGLVKIDSGTSIAQNTSISGGKCGVFIGKNVMIAPNCVITAFSHGYSNLSIPMNAQENKFKKITIEDDVWIAANSSIAYGVTIHSGAIIGANSFVNKDVKEYQIVGGVPARPLKNRKDSRQLN
jgi:acetyltransferase-like isoleucine patch superfamily enzyme